MKKPGSTHPVLLQATHPPPVTVESQSHANWSEHLLKERELQEQEHQQRLETERQLQEQLEREQQEKEAVQKQVRDLQLQLEQGHRESAKLQFLPR